MSEKLKEQIVHVGSSALSIHLKKNGDYILETTGEPKIEASLKKRKVVAVFPAKLTVEIPIEITGTSSKNTD